MSDLTRESCTACKGGEPTLTDAELAALLPAVPAWRVVERDGIRRLAREFKFADFKAAMAFAVSVGEVAEREGHHPDLYVAWGKLGVETWTHAIGGLHKNDFVLAAKIDALVPASEPLSY
jgi:4a-hydroxytetrahydrobiopterin dehydratase